MADWADLPTDMLLLIAQQHIVSMEDYLSFCSVCRSWQSVTTTLGKKPSLPPRSPWAMLPDSSMKGKKLDEEDPRSRMLEPPEETKDSQGRQMRRFYSLSTSKIHEFELPEATHRKCMGVSYGWLVTFGYDFQITLLHPFSRNQIRLPHLLSFKRQYGYDEVFVAENIVDMFVTKIVLSENPTAAKNFTAVAIYGEKRTLAFARRGDEAWTDIDSNSMVYEDVVYYNNMFYAVDCHKVLFLCDVNNRHGPRDVQIAEAPVGYREAGWQNYLVESSGNLLLISRSLGWEDEDSTRSLTCNFLIFKLEASKGDCEYRYVWVEVKSLGGRALFLGNNVSKLLDSSERVKADCIYFSEDSCESYLFDPNGGGRDTGIFNVKEGTIGVHSVAKFQCPLSPPLWYI